MSISTKSTNINANSIEAIVPTSDTITIGADQTTGILNIGGGKNVRLQTSLINIGTDTTFLGPTGTINIGSTNKNSRILPAGTHSFNGLTTVHSSMRFGALIIIRTDGALPAPAQLGGTTYAPLLTTTPVNGSIYGTLDIPEAGIYIFQFNLYQTASTKGTTNYVTFSGVTGSNVNTTRYGATSVDGNNFGFSGSQTVRATLSPYTLTYTTGTTGTTVTTCSGAVSGYISATRIT